jgi:SAM-dependent methyltransferase
VKTHDDELTDKYLVDGFPLSSTYDMHWVVKNEMGPNVLLLTESLCQVMTIEPGMRVLDMGCGTAMSSIFLAKEFGVQVWATDLWISASENLARIREAGLEDSVFPVHAEAHNLPFADDYFDAIVSMDSYHYYGTDVHYLEFHMLKLLKPGGRIGIISPASIREVPPLPAHLSKETWHWLNSVNWWRNHWERAPGLDVELAEELPDGWSLWVRWEEFLELYGSRNSPSGDDLESLRRDNGEYLGFVRMVAHRSGAS